MIASALLRCNALSVTALCANWEAFVASTVFEVAVC